MLPVRPSIVRWLFSLIVSDPRCSAATALGYAIPRRFSLACCWATDCPGLGQSIGFSNAAQIKRNLALLMPKAAAALRWLSPLRAAARAYDSISAISVVCESALLAVLLLGIGIPRLSYGRRKTGVNAGLRRLL